jgi:hypothetical protein
MFNQLLVCIPTVQISETKHVLQFVVPTVIAVCRNYTDQVGTKVWQNCTGLPEISILFPKQDLQTSLTLFAYQTLFYYN